MIARLPDRRWTVSEMRRIAGGLIDLLPPATKRGKDDELTSTADRKISSQASPFFIYVALAGAVLISLFTLAAL